MIEWAPQEETTGASHGVLYLDEGAFVWNGLVDITQHSGDDSIDQDLYYDGVRFGLTQAPEDFSVGIAAWSYPKEFEQYEGYDLYSPADKQPRRPFGLSYVEGYFLHLVWNATATPTDIPHSSKNNEFEITQFTWALVTVKKDIPGADKSAHMQIDLRTAPEEAMIELHSALYGTVSTDPYLPEPSEVIDIFLTYPVLIVTDNGDGTATITGPDEAVYMLDSITARIHWPSVRPVTMDKYNISSM